MTVIPGEGMPSHRHHEFGDLYVQFEVMMPTYEDFGFDDDERPEDKLAAFGALRTILPKPKYLNLPPEDYHGVIDTRDFKTFDEMDQDKMQGVQQGEDDEDGAGGERVQCATQ